MDESVEMKEITTANGDLKKEKSENKLKSCLKTNLLTIATVSGVVLGGVLGFILKETAETEWTARQIMYINFLGDLFLRALKCLILPLIVSSLISAIANLDLSLSGKIAARAIVYYITTTVFAVILGIILVISIQPGKHADSEQKPIENATIRDVTTEDTLLDLLRNMFPPNLIQSCLQQYRTVLTPDNKTEIHNWAIGEEYTDGMNILGLVVFSAVFGIALAILGREGKALTDVFSALASAMMKITTWVIWTSPVGVMFLVAAKILEMKNIGAVMEQLGMYFSTVLIGIVLHGFVVLSAIYFLMTRKSPFRYMGNMAQAMATAFGTSSSSATLPVTLACLEDKLGLDSRVTRFVIPIGSTINMDGTALYEAVAAIFIAQLRNVDLDVGKLIAISITATAASIGAAGIPQAGLVTMVMVLDTVGLPAQDVSLIIAVDWLLDRFRTLINVLGDAYGAGIVYHLSRTELNKLEQRRLSSVQNST